jgi:hypothetical protein
MRRFNKYNAKRTADGFPSKLEAAVYRLLQLRVLSGELRDLRRQHTVVLQEGGKEVRIAWKCDFSAEEVATGRRIFFEAKGVETSEYILKLKLWRKNPPFDLEIWKGHYARPFLAERIRKP